MKASKCKITRNGFLEFKNGRLSFSIEYIKKAPKKAFCEVYYRNTFVGYGFFEKNKKFCLRIYSTDEKEIDEVFFSKIKAAIQYRKKIGYFKSGRIVFGDSDGLPGLIIDKYNDIIVIISETSLYEGLLSRLTSIFGENVTIYRKDKNFFIWGQKKRDNNPRGESKIFHRHHKRPKNRILS